MVEEKETKPQEKTQELKSAMEIIQERLAKGEVLWDTKEKEIKKSSGESLLSKLQRERDEFLEQLKRIKAEFINYKNRIEKEKEKQRILSIKDIFFELLEVLDNFDRATQVEINENNKMLLEGIIFIKKQIEDIMKKRGLEQIEVKKGDKFDPTLHEALSITEVEQEKDNTIVEIIRAGFRFHEYVLRPAQVIVGKKKEVSSQEEKDVKEE